MKNMQGRQTAGIFFHGLEGGCGVVFNFYLRKSCDIRYNDLFSDRFIVADKVSVIFNLIST